MTETPESKASCDMVELRDRAAVLAAHSAYGVYVIFKREGGYRIAMRLPEGTYNDLAISPNPQGDFRSGNEPVWKWDMSYSRPTLEPSIQCHGCWHGYIKAGRMESC